MVYPSGEVERRIQRSGAAGPQGLEYHHDLHPYSQPRPCLGAQPCRSCVAASTCGSLLREPHVLLGYVYLKPHAGTGFSQGARAPLGVVFRRPKGAGVVLETSQQRVAWTR